MLVIYNPGLYASSMKIAAFIRANIQPIAVEWEAFAATLLPDEQFSASVLRDGIVEMLHEIASNMDRAESTEQQEGKSERNPRPQQHVEDAAERHALERVKMGLSSRQLIAEFRALRATIIRLWHRDLAGTEGSLHDLTSFNDAIDQALSEAAVTHTKEIDRSSQLFLGILGHDLKTPVGAILGYAQLQLRSETPERYQHFASQILISARRMSHLITDLIELTRVRLGSGIAINPIRTNMRRICETAIEEVRAINPEHGFQLNCDDDLPDEWDETRIMQVLSNLLGNAIQHGAANLPVTLTAKGDRDGIQFAVHNEGAAIPPNLMPSLFDCLFQGGATERADDDHSASLGLGLYIAREIVLAHQGTIEVHSSDDEGTTFVVRLPRSIRASV
jgi:signal transduction histidine kinase